MSKATAPVAPREALRLVEHAWLLTEAPETPDGQPVAPGNLVMHLIRPCVGRGRGRHVYTSEMLRENSAKFAGWRMYINHLSEAARRAAGGLPRDVRDLGGRVVRSWWDSSVPADERFEEGAVVAEVRPTPFIRELAENDAELLRVSISARATSVKPVMRDGKRAWLVEGIEPHGSVDWVTEDGAGGRVVSLMESVYHDQEDIDMALLESLTDDEFMEHLRENRPQLLEALSQEPERPEPDPKEDAVALSPEDLREALHSDEGRELVRTMLREEASELVRTETRELLEAELEDRAEIIREEARADADRRIQVRDLRDEAHRLIEGAELPQRITGNLKKLYNVRPDGEPTAALNVIDEVDDQGEVTKPAADVLREAVEGDIQENRELVGELTPTLVRGQGPADAASEDGDGEGRVPLWKRELQEAGINPDEAY